MGEHAESASDLHWLGMLGCDTAHSWVLLLVGHACFLAVYHISMKTTTHSLPTDPTLLMWNAIGAFQSELGRILVRTLQDVTEEQLAGPSFLLLGIIAIRPQVYSPTAVS